MRVAILTVQVPFVRGGAEAHAFNLRQAIRDRGVEAEIVAIPFCSHPPGLIVDQILACQLLDLSESCGTPIDRTIGLKFPAYTIPHHHKVMWILHQHRSAYDLWEQPGGDLHPHPDGADITRLVRHADAASIPQDRPVFVSSRVVGERLQRFSDVAGTILHHPPPDAQHYKCLTDDAFLLVPGRINALKRQELMIRALAHTRRRIRVVFIGAPDEAGAMQALGELSRDLPPGSVEWRGQVPLAEKLLLYGSCRAVASIPSDEDYGYVALEAMLASKPVLTCSDSGGPLDFVRDGQTGTVCAPEPTAIARAIDRLWENPTRTRSMGRAGRAHYDALNLSWDHVVATLLA